LKQLNNPHFEFYLASLLSPHTYSTMFFCIAYGFVLIRHAWTPMPVTTQILKDLLCLWRVAINFLHLVPLADAPPISGMNYIVPCLTNVCQPLNSFSRLTVTHTIPPLGKMPTVSGFKNMVRNTLLQIDEIVKACLK
jgi:hypothetical protein